MAEVIKRVDRDKLTQEEMDEGARLRPALAALRFEVIWAEHQSDEREREALKRGLTKGFGNDPAQVEALVEQAHAHIKEATSIYPLTRLVMERSSEEERRELVTQLWQVALADDVLDKYEEHTIRKIADLLYLSHADFIAAKREARARLGGDD